MENRLTNWPTVVILRLVRFIISLRYCFSSGTHKDKFKNVLSVRLTGQRSAVISDPVFVASARTVLLPKGLLPSPLLAVRRAKLTSLSSQSILCK